MLKIMKNGSFKSFIRLFALTLVIAPVYGNWTQKLGRLVNTGSYALSSVAYAGLARESWPTEYKPELYPYANEADEIVGTAIPVSPNLDKKIRAYLGNLVPQDKPLIILQYPQGAYTPFEYASAPQNKNNNYVTVTESLINDFTSWLTFPQARHALRHEMGHLHHNHYLNDIENQKKYSLAALGLSVFAAFKTAKIPKGFFGPVSLLSIPLYITGSWAHDVLERRKHEYEAEKYAWQTAPEAELAGYVWGNKIIDAFSGTEEPRNLTVLIDRYITDEEMSYEELESKFTHPGEYEQYHMALEEMQKRSLKNKK